MAYDVSGLSAYTEEHLFDLITASTAGNKTAQLVTLQPGVKGSAKIQILDSPITIQEDDCAWNASGTTTLTSRTITAYDMKVNMSFCEKDLVGKYTQKMLKAGANEEGKELVFEEVILGELTANLAYELEKADWQGDQGNTAVAANLQHYDGFIKNIDAGSPVNGNVDSVATAVGITASNILDILWGMYSVIPDAIVDKDDLCFFIGMDNFNVLERAIFAANLYHYTPENDGKSMRLPGSSVVVEGVQGLTGTDRIFLGRKSNFIIGMDLENDEEKFDMFYSKDNREIRLDVAWKRGTQIAFPAEVVQFTLV